MSATITAVGTWTPLNFDPIGLPATGLNQPGATNTLIGTAQKGGQNLQMLFNAQLEQLKTFDLPELMQFVQAMADGYNINFEAAASLLYACVTAFQNRQSPIVSRANLYTP